MSYTTTPHGNWWGVFHVADSFALLPQAADGQYDVTITDPPYEEHCQSNQMSGTTLAKVDLPFAPLASRTWIRDIVRITKRWAVVCCTVEDFGRFCDLLGGRKDDGGAWVRGGIWYKPNSMGQLTGDRPAAAYEGVGICHRHIKGKYQWNGRGSYALWSADPVDVDPFFTANSTRGEEDRHPNQKPLKVCLEWVNKFSNHGETIFDPWAGSGRIGEAALMLGRNYIGWDFDPKWVDRARARLAATSAGSLMGWFPCDPCKGPECKACLGIGQVYRANLELNACPVIPPKTKAKRGPTLADRIL